MEIEAHNIDDPKMVEFISTNDLNSSTEVGLDVLGNLYYQECKNLVIHGENTTPAFFYLKNGFADEPLQKFSNYCVRLARAGDFSKYAPKRVSDSILESIKGKPVYFVASQSKAIKV